MYYIYVYDRSGAQELISSEFNRIDIPFLASLLLEAKKLSLQVFTMKQNNKLSLYCDLVVSETYFKRKNIYQSLKVLN